MNKILFYGAILGLISVIMGALGDHAFDFTPEQSESIATAIRYNMVYAVLITVLACAPAQKKLHIPALIFAIGTSIFSFSIYIALISEIEQITYLTPIGGIILMLAWIFLAAQALSFRNQD